LWKSGPFTWTEEAKQAFQELKKHLVSLPILVAPEPGEPLYLYIAAAVEAVSMVLVVERMAQEDQVALEGQEPEGSTGVRTV
jgi:ribonuclease HI